MIIEREFDMKDGVKNCINKVLEDIDNISMGLEVFCVLIDKDSLNDVETLKYIYENQYFKEVIVKETKTDFEVYLPETDKVWDRYNSNRFAGKMKHELKVEYIDGEFSLLFRWKISKKEDMYKSNIDMDKFE